MFFNINNLPKGKLISSVDSPNKEYTFKSYICNGGGNVFCDNRPAAFQVAIGSSDGGYYEDQPHKGGASWFLSSLSS